MAFQVADHVGLTGDGDGADDAVVVSAESPRRLRTTRVMSLIWGGGDPRVLQVGLTCSVAGLDLRCLQGRWQMHIL